MDYIIRREEARDHRAVELLTREAFWNLYIPGCDEHYLVHQIRTCSDYIPELTFVAVSGGSLVGHIIFTRSYITDSQNHNHETVTFGPVSVLPAYQNQGIGSRLIRHAANEARLLGYRAITIYGYPDYYKKLGFAQGKHFGISNEEGRFPAAHLVLPLYPDALKGIRGKASESPVFQVDPAAAAAFDQGFPPKEKFVTESQTKFEHTASLYL